MRITYRIVLAHWIVKQVVVGKLTRSPNHDRKAVWPGGEWTSLRAFAQGAVRIEMHSRETQEWRSFEAIGARVTDTLQTRQCASAWPYLLFKRAFCNVWAFPGNGIATGGSICVSFSCAGNGPDARGSY